MIITQRFVSLDARSVVDAMQEWLGRWPDMGVLALLPESEIDQVSILQTCADRLDIPLLGAIFPALVTDTGFQTSGAWLLCFATMPPNFLIGDVHENGSAKMALAYETLAFQGQAAGRRILLTIFDAMVPNIGTLMDQMHQQISQAPFYVGVNAGSETFQPMPCLFDRTRLVGNGVIGLLMSEGPRAIVQHDYPVSKVLMRASSAEGNRIASIDGRPAFDVYQDVIRDEFGVALTRDNFYEYAVHFPFGVVTAVDVLVRIPVMLGEDGSLFCVGEIAPNSMLRLLRAPALSASTCVASICRSLQDAVPQDGSFSLLSFYCAGRRMHFKDDAVTELTQLKTETGTQGLFGALSLGEIDSFEDFNFPRFHNAAIVCLPQIQN